MKSETIDNNRYYQKEDIYKLYKERSLNKREETSTESSFRIGTNYVKRLGVKDRRDFFILLSHLFPNNFSFKEKKLNIPLSSGSDKCCYPYISYVTDKRNRAIVSFTISTEKQ